MFPNDPVEAREQMLRDNCDQIEPRSFTRSFNQDEVNDRRAELESVSIQVAELEDELAQVRADTYKFVDVDEGRTAYYSADGYKIEERAMTPEERQRNIIQAARFLRTGTDD